MKRVLLFVFCCSLLTACSGGERYKHLPQREQWKALGYQDGLKSVRQGP